MIRLSEFRRRSTSRWAAVLGLLSQFPTVTLGLRTAPGSPCAGICAPSSNTTSSEIVCLDHDYRDTANGQKFQSCVSCELNSTYSDIVTGQTDVQWGLYNLRFAFTTCVYGFPNTTDEFLSNPCTVACADLEPALEYDLVDFTSTNFNTWCGTSSFANNEINTCETCYNQTAGTSRQSYLSNFLESLRYNCYFETPTNSQFPITPSRIFTESMLPSSTVDLTSPTPQSGLGVSNLALVIALPILGFVILICVLAIGCFFFIRSRRKKMRRLHQSSHLHARWNDTSISTPQWATEYPVQAQDMYSSPVTPAMYHPGYMAGLGFIDTDGRSQEVGYSKMMEPVIATPSTAYSPEEKYPPPHSFFSSPASDSKHPPP